MSIDRERYEQFRRELAGFLSQLDAEERYRVIESKLVDWLSRNDPDAEDLVTFQRQARNILDDDLAPFVERIRESFEGTLDVINELYDDIGPEMSKDLPRIRQIERVSDTQLGDYKESVIADMKRQLRKGLLADESVDALRKRIAPLSQKASFYANTIAQTQVKALGRTSKAEKARLGEVPFFEYVGVVRDTTRPFCRALAGTTHHVNSIRQMRNGNLEPVMQYCGGWNCIHDWEPDPFAAPEDQLDGEVVEREEGNQTVRLIATESEMKDYDEAKELNG